jgi:hypothetical protein
MTDKAISTQPILTDRCQNNTSARGKRQRRVSGNGKPTP